MKWLIDWLPIDELFLTEKPSTSSQKETEIQRKNWISIAIPILIHIYSIAPNMI